MNCDLCGQELHDDPAVEGRESPPSAGTGGGHGACTTICGFCAERRWTTHRLFWWAAIALVAGLLATAYLGF